MFRLLAIMMLAFAGASPASAQEQGEQWRVQSETGHAFASTINSAGEELGLNCQEKCQYMVVFNIGCQEGGIIPVIANGSRADAVMVDLTCHVAEGSSFFYLDDLDMTKLMAGDAIAFAWPSGEQLISVSRFSLKGAKEATASVFALWKKAAPPVAPGQAH